MPTTFCTDRDVSSVPRDAPLDWLCLLTVLAFDCIFFGRKLLFCAVFE